MHSHNATLYPMLGVGAFMSMFWTGVVVGHELGVGCVTLLILGLLSGAIATVGVCELQRRDREGFAGGERAPAHGSTTTRSDACAAKNGRRPWRPVPVAGSAHARPA